MDAYALAYLAAGFGSGLVILGASYGIGKLAAAAMEASGRQPEVLREIRTTMIIAADRRCDLLCSRDLHLARTQDCVIGSSFHV